MTIKIRKLSPHEIESESFRIIETELGDHSFRAMEFPIIRRVIHATGDFSFSDLLHFHPLGVETGVEATIAGKNILVDVNMVASGINRDLLKRWGGEVLCGISDFDVSQLAKDKRITRSETAIEKYLLGNNVGIVAIGNAPTALLKTIEILGREPAQQPFLIVGVPVGFVNAAESKEMLMLNNHPFITCKGRKGGSPVAAAIINGLLQLAAKR